MTKRPIAPGVSAAALLVAMATVAAQVLAHVLGSGREGYVVAREMIAPVLGLVLTVGFGASAYLAWKRGSRAGLVAMGGSIVITLGLLGVRSNLDAPLERDVRQASPDGRRVLVADSATGTLDPWWDLSVETTDGLRSRFQNVGCIDGDVRNLSSARWISDREIEIRLDDGTAPHVRLDARGHATSDAALTDACAAA